MTVLGATPPASAAEGSALSVAILYQDGPTKLWARQLCERVTRIVGQDGFRATWWKMSDLTEPGVLAGAVSMAIRADVLVVALHASQDLPLAFYVWAEAWMPHRLAAAGSLLALIDLPDQPSSQSDRAREYLHAIAQQARLDFLVEERKLPSDLAELGRETDADRFSAPPPPPSMTRRSLALTPMLSRAE